MPIVVREVIINAPRSSVWEVLADIGSVSEWNPVVSHSVETSDSTGVAAVGDSRYCELPDSMGAISETVTAWDHERSQSFQVEGARMMRRMHATFDLHDASEPPQPTTEVRMTGDFSMKFGPIGSLMAATMGKRMMAANMEHALNGLKEHVEARVAKVDQPDAVSTN
jgi:carbon monoxide dehydrogenase subunit G